VDGLLLQRGIRSFSTRINDSLPGAIKRFEDTSFGMKRIEIVCANCGGHLVYLFCEVV
jgi:peptide methionine sulfoxide reductase MsrB